jgi:RNA polymerase sigma-70 factor (ECF subfamily)
MAASQLPRTTMGGSSNRGVGGEPAESLALDVRRGRKGAFERLVQDQQDSLFGYALRLVQDAADAQDVTQEAFLRAHRALTSAYDEERCRTLELRPWLFRITRNLALNRLRQRRAAREEPLPEADGHHESALRFLAFEEGTLAARERKRHLERGLGRLGREAREIVQLRYIENLSYAEIAAVAGGSEAAVRGKVFRALARLRAHLNEEEACHAM